LNIAFFGCTIQKYIGNPVLRRKGNPRESPSLANYLKSLSEETAEYIIQGSEPLDPWEYFRVRTYFCSTGDPYDLMFCTMVLVGCSLYLREDELSQITIDDIDLKLASITDNIIDSIGIWVQGKRDVGRVLLMLWANHSNPEICPVRHLLLWLHVSRIRKVFIFPPQDSLNMLMKELKKNPLAIFDSKFQIDYSIVLDRIKDCFQNVTGREAIWNSFHEENGLRFKHLGWR
jgi:hypothetical protein